MTRTGYGLRRAAAIALVPLALLWLHPGFTKAATSDQVPIGPRAIGMGGAFTAVADDVSALYWNPAGLSLIGHQEIAGYNANLYGSDVKDSYLAFLLPLSSRLAVGADWYHSGFEDSELNFGENRFDLALAARVHPMVSVGLTGKLLTRSVDLDGNSFRDGNGVGLDVGVLAMPTSRLTLGVIGQDIFDTEVNNNETNVSAVAYPHNFRVGASYKPTRYTRVAFDVDDRYHLGVEFFPLKQFSIRAGLQKDRTTDESILASLGGSVELSIFRFDFAHENHPVLGSTNHLGITTAFHFNPSRIRIEQVQTQPLFTSLYKSYAVNPFGTVVVRNLRDEPLVTRFQVFIPEYMDEPSEQEIVLRPRASQEIPLTAVFTEKAVAEAGDRPIQVELSATYQSARLPRTEKRTLRTVSYGPGAISWARGVEQAAAFVTSQDQVISAFAREASRPVALSEQPAFGNRNIAFAAAIFSALEDLGVAYVPDPHNPFNAISETEEAVDTIHYPRETLLKRSGDCDDTTVLLASMLGNVGTETRFVDAPGHLFLLFDSGLHERNRLSLSLDETLYTVIDGRVWIPLETTALGRGFAKAWEIGAEEYLAWEQRGHLQTVSTNSAQLLYEPASLPEDVTVPEWQFPNLTQRMTTATTIVGVWQEEYLASRFGDSREDLDVSPTALAQLARVYYQAGDLDKARERLEKILAADPTSPGALNNLAVIHAAKGDYVLAVSGLEAALERATGDPGIWLNLALVHQAAGNREEAESALARGIELAGGAEAARDIVALPAPSDTPEKADRILEESSGKVIQDHLYWKGS